MLGSSHTQSVLISIKYQNWRQTLDVYLLFTISMGQIQTQSQFTNFSLTHHQVDYLVTSPLSNFDSIGPIQIAKRK